MLSALIEEALADVNSVHDLLPLREEEDERELLLDGCLEDYYGKKIQAAYLELMGINISYRKSMVLCMLIGDSVVNNDRSWCLQKINPTLRHRKETQRQSD